MVWIVDSQQTATQAQVQEDWEVPHVVGTETASRYCERCQQYLVGLNSVRPPILVKNS